MKAILFVLLFILHIYSFPIYSQTLINNQFYHNYPSLNSELKRNFNFISFDDHLVLPWSQDEFIQFTFEGLELNDALTGEIAVMPIPQFVGSFESQIQLGFKGNSQSVNLKKNQNQKDLTGFIEYEFDGFQPSGKTILGTDGISLGYRNFTAMVSGQVPFIENSQFAVAGRQMQSLSFWKNDEPVGEKFGGMNYDNIDFYYYDRENQKIENFSSSLIYPKYRKNASFDQKDINISLVLPYREFEFSYVGLFNQMKGNEGILPLEIFNPDHQMQRNKTTYANQFGLKINFNEYSQLNFKFSHFSNFVEQNDSQFGSDISSFLSVTSNPFYYRYSNNFVDQKKGAFFLKYGKNEFDQTGLPYSDYYKTEQNRIQFSFDYQFQFNDNHLVTLFGKYRESKLRKLKYNPQNLVYYFNSAEPKYHDELFLSKANKINQYGYDFLGKEVDSKYFPVKVPNEWTIGVGYSFTGENINFYIGMDYMQFDFDANDINSISGYDELSLYSSLIPSGKQSYFLPNLMFIINPNKYYSASIGYKKQAYSPVYDRTFTGFGKSISILSGWADHDRYFGIKPINATLINLNNRFTFSESNSVELVFYQNERLNTTADSYKNIMYKGYEVGILFKGSSDEALIDQGVAISHKYSVSGIFSSNVQFLLNRGLKEIPTKTYQFSENIGFKTSEKLPYGFDNLNFSLTYFFTKEEAVYLTRATIYLTNGGDFHTYKNPFEDYFVKNYNSLSVLFYPQQKQYQNIDLKISKTISFLNIELFVLCQNLINDTKLYEKENFYQGERDPQQIREYMNKKIKETYGQKALDIYKDIKENNRPELYSQPRNIIIGMKYNF